MKSKRFRIVPDNISGCKVQRWYWFWGWIDMDDEGFINTFKSVDDAVKALESYLTNNKVLWQAKVRNGKVKILNLKP